MIKKIKQQLKGMKYVLRMHSHRKGNLVKALFFHQIVAIFPVLTGLAIKKAFDFYALGPEDNPVLWTILLFLSLLMGRVIFVAFHSYFNSKGRFILSSDLRLSILSGILKKPGAESINLSTGDTLNRIKVDTDQIETFAYGNMLDVMTSLTMTLVTMFILCSIDAVMTFFVFTPILLMVYIMERSGRHVSKYRMENRKSTSGVSSAIGEIFENIQAVQVNAAEDSVLNYLKALNRKRAKNATKDNVFSQILGTLYENLFNIGTGVILLFMAFMSRQTSFSLGNFVIFTYYMNFISFFIMFAGNAFTRYKQVQVSFEHLSDIHDAMDSMSLTSKKVFNEHSEENLYDEVIEENNPLHSLVLNQVNYSYSDGQIGLKDIQLSIKKDSLNVVAGRIGSGKSTLLKIIAGLLKVNQGSIYWNDELVDDMDTFMIPPRVSYTPQIPRFFSSSIKDNMLLGYPATEQAIDNALYCSVLEPDLDSLGEGIESAIGTNGVKLSGGQQLRLAVARMLLRKADLYVFDDISSALDVETDRIMWERILKKKEGTYIVVSNQKKILEKADNIILLKDGKLEGMGTYDDLISQNEEMKLIIDAHVGVN